MDSKFKSTFNFYNDDHKDAFAKAILDMPSNSLKPVNHTYYSKMQTMDNHEIRMKHVFFHLKSYDDNSKGLFNYFLHRYDEAHLADPDKILVTPVAYVQGGNREYSLFNDDNIDSLLEKLFGSLRDSGINIDFNEFMSAKSLFGLVAINYVDDVTGQFLPNGINLDVCYVSSMKKLVSN